MKIHSRQLLVESSLKQLYISSTYYIINNHRCKNKNFGFWCTNEPTQITMDRKMATTFLILAKTFMHTVYIIQCQQWIHRFKTKTLVSLYTNETTQTTNFSIDHKNGWHKRQLRQPVFCNSINRFMYFLQ